MKQVIGSPNHDITTHLTYKRSEIAAPFQHTNMHRPNMVSFYMVPHRPPSSLIRCVTPSCCVQHIFKISSLSSSRKCFGCYFFDGIRKIDPLYQIAVHYYMLPSKNYIYTISGSWASGIILKNPPGWKANPYPNTPFGGNTISLRYIGNITR